MSAQSVWSCIKSYRNDSAQQILKAYIYSEVRIINTLEMYPDKDKYHGHESGGSGDGVNPEADKNLTAAISFLNSRIPAVETSTSTKSGPNTVLKNASVSASTNLIDVIKSESNLGLLVSRLDGLDSGWKKKREVWDAYSLKYFQKKGTYPKK